LEQDRFCENLPVLKNPLRDSPVNLVHRFMNEQFLKFRANHIFGLVTAFSLGISSPALWAQENPGHAGGRQGSMKSMEMSDEMSDDPIQAWTMVQQLVNDMGTAVQSKNLHGIHEPTMKIRGPIKTLKGHSSMLSGDKGQKISAALKQLDSTVTDLHSAADEGSQAKSEEALKAVENALDQLKAQDPAMAFKHMH
jgi:hypothetical protein